METESEKLLIQIDQQVKYLTSAVNEMRCDLHERFVTRELCALRQSEHENQNNFGRAESLAKIGVLLSVALSVIWAVVKHT